MSFQNYLHWITLGVNRKSQGYAKVIAQAANQIEEKSRRRSDGGNDKRSGNVVVMYDVDVFSTTG